jgi:PAS domain S-box-containing protein
VKRSPANFGPPDELRIKAERLLTTTSGQIAKLPLGDVQRLVHELQVHQIELEMQNDELRRTQRELEVARERLLLPYDAAPIGFLSVDEQGIIHESNLAAARLVACDRLKLNGRKLAHFVAPESQDAFYLYRRRLLHIEEKSTCELRMIGQDGLPFIARLESVRDAAWQSPATRWLVMISDITEQKRAETALQQAQEQLEERVRERTKELTRANAALRGEKAFSDSLIELAPAVVAVIDSQGNLIRTNDYAEQLAGYPFAETQGRNMVALFIPAEEQARIRHLLQAALAGNTVQAFVAPLRTRDGSIRQIEWFCKALANAAGEPSAVLAIGHDITERQRMEEELRRSEHHLQNFFNAAPIGLAWLSPSGTILRANQAQLDLLGSTPGEYVGHSFLEFGVDASLGRELLERLAKKEVVRNLRMARRRKDGAIIHVLVDANPFWSGSRFQYSSIFMRDITDRVKLEQEILHVSEREHRRIAQDLHDGLGQLLVGAAYVAGTLRQDLAAKSPAAARKAGRIVEVLTDAIWQTRDLSRGLHPVEADPAGLMTALESLAARTKKLFNIHCHFDCRRPVLVPDNMVATHLFRIAQESVTNAIKHGRPGSIEIALAETPGKIILAVKDDGKGMPARPRKPAGMGLRIMRYRAGMTGGSLAIQKAPGGGTTVVCTVHLSGAGALPKNEPDND